jgi:hypothetical protein
MFSNRPEWKLVHLLFTVQYKTVYCITIRMEAGSNTAAVTLRVLKGDEKGILCLGV